MADSEIGVWYRNIPQLTRYWFTSVVAVPLAAKFGLVSGFWLILDYYSFFHKFQIWRPITAAMYYPITPMTGFHYLITLYFIYSYSLRLETGIFAGRPADYAFLLLFTWATSVGLALVFEIKLLLEIMMFVVLYVWCQINRDQIVSFWFGTRFKASYLPWVLVAFNLIVRGSVMLELMGIFVGHLYFFLKFKYPIDFGGSSFIETPGFMYRLFPNKRNTVSGFGTAPTSRRNIDNVGGGDHQWGRGNRLGDD